MKFLSRIFQYVCILLGCITGLCAENQTPDVSPVFLGTDLPFRVRLEVEDFVIPSGLQSYVFGTYQGKWLLLAGRTNGLHGFENDINNFPPQKQNFIVYVIDPIRKTVASRSLTSSRSGLTQDQIESLAVTSPQFYQSGNLLYITGGYGFRSAVNNFVTFDTLTAINMPGLIHWVTHRSKCERAAQHIQQIPNPMFQIAGGYMTKIGKNPTLLVFGQDFEGPYVEDLSKQIYSRQIRRFQIQNHRHLFPIAQKCSGLDVDIKSSKPSFPDPNFRRRDLNVVPIVLRNTHQGFRRSRLVQGLVALSGVFTTTDGAWTVPVLIDANGNPFMPDPSDPSTFKQGMNNYASAALGLFSNRKGDMYTVLFGGISYGFFENGTFQTDPELPFINQITTIKIDKKRQFTQYLMDEEFPVILSTQSNPGNRLLFGAGSDFILSEEGEGIKYSNGVLALDKINRPTLVGYIVGGIQSTLPNTNIISDSAASPYIFKVIVEPKHKHCQLFDSAE